MINRRLSPAMQLALVFLLFGLTWITLTDLASLGMAHDSMLYFTRMQTYKGIFFILVSCLLIYFVSRKIFKKQENLQQALADERLHYKNELAQGVFNAQEAERKKIGEELHDNINQLLGVIKLYIEHAQVNPSAKGEMLRKSSEYLMQVINEIRGLSKSLISSTLKDIGLVASIHELTESIQEIKTIEIELNTDHFSENELSDIKKLMIYRIVQEQLNNILKHSRAEHVDIELRRSQQAVHLTIEDDGMGFDMENTRSGLGLKNIQHRLELFNGEMVLQSSPGQGCKIEARFDA